MKGKDIVVEDVNLNYVFEHEDKLGFNLTWDSNIGFGEMTFIKPKDSDKYLVETECMSDNEDKEFIHLVLNKFIEKLEVVE